MKKIAYSIFILSLLGNTQVAAEGHICNTNNQSSDPYIYEGFEVLNYQEMDFSNEDFDDDNIELGDVLRQSNDNCAEVGKAKKTSKKMTRLAETAKNRIKGLSKKGKKKMRVLAKKGGKKMRMLAKKGEKEVRVLAKKVLTVENAKNAANFTCKAAKVTAKFSLKAAIFSCKAVKVTAIFSCKAAKVTAIAVYKTCQVVHESGVIASIVIQGGYDAYQEYQDNRGKGTLIYVNKEKRYVNSGDRIDTSVEV